MEPLLSSEIPLGSREIFTSTAGWKEEGCFEVKKKDATQSEF